MKKVIRKGVFETNSSSAHAFAFLNKNDEEYDLYEKNLYKITDNEKKMIVFLSSCDMFAKQAKSNLIYWLQNYMKETFSDWAKAKEFADEIVELGDFEKIKDYLRSRKEFNEKFILSHLDEDTYIYFTDDPYDAFVHDTMTKEYLGFEAIVDAENKKREAIAAYARFLNKSVDEVNKSIEKHRISNNALLCESLFSEGPLDDCNCDIEKLAMDAFNSSLSTEEYIINLLNDEKSIFQVEYYGQSYCNIKELLSEKSNR